MLVNTIAALDYWMIVPLFLLGAALHFTYDWSKHNKRVAYFSAVNESYWEHIKIAFWPVFLLSIFEFALGGYSHAAFIPAKTIALYSIPVSMVSIVFIYKFFTKQNVLALDIAAFLVSIIIAQSISALIIVQLAANIWTVAISLLFLAFLVAAFALFTKYPPKEPDLFRDPISSEYGLKGHR